MRCITYTTQSTDILGNIYWGCRYSKRFPMAKIIKISDNMNTLQEKNAKKSSNSSSKSYIMDIYQNLLIIQQRGYLNLRHRDLKTTG